VALGHFGLYAAGGWRWLIGADRSFSAVHRLPGRLPCRPPPFPPAHDLGLSGIQDLLRPRPRGRPELVLPAGWIIYSGGAGWVL
jgi:hypothetical protein